MPNRTFYHDKLEEKKTVVPSACPHDVIIVFPIATFMVGLQAMPPVSSPL